MLDASVIADSELLEIADTLVGLRAPPTQLPPPLPSPAAPNSASYPRPQHNSPILSLAPNEIRLEGSVKLGSSSSESISGGSGDGDEAMKNIVMTEASEVRVQGTKQLSADVDIDVDDVYSMANVRRIGQPGKTFVHVSVQTADQGLPHVPATCATGAMRESSERFLLAGDVFANTNLDIFDSVLQPAGFGFAHAPLSTGSATSGSLECALRVADTPPPTPMSPTVPRLLRGHGCMVGACRPPTTVNRHRLRLLSRQPPLPWMSRPSSRHLRRRPLRRRRRCRPPVPYSPPSRPSSYTQNYRRWSSYWALSLSPDAQRIRLL